MNVKWHDRHVMPKRASLEQRIEWHREHQVECGCRPIPARLLEQMQSIRGTSGTAAAPEARRAPSASAVGEHSSVAGEHSSVAGEHSSVAGEHSSVADTKFSNIVLAFANQPSVTYGGKGFGRSALQFNGKIFVMLTSQAQFVVKLSRERVAQLVEQQQGQYFDPGHGRMMMDWLVVPSSSARWLELAKEAHTAAAGRPSRISHPPATRSSVSRPSKARARKARTNRASMPKPVRKS